MSEPIKGYNSTFKIGNNFSIPVDAIQLSASISPEAANAACAKVQANMEQKLLMSMQVSSDPPATAIYATEASTDSPAKIAVTYRFA